MNEENAGRVSEERLEYIAGFFETVPWPSHVDKDAAIAIRELLTLRAADHPAVVVRVKPLDTAPSGDDALEPAELDVHEGSWALVIGTNGKPAGWIDTHELFAHQLYRDQILPEPLRPATEQAGGEVVADGFQRGVQFCLGVVDKVETAAREKGWEDEATGAIDVREAIISASPPSPAATQSAVVAVDFAKLYDLAVAVQIGPEPDEALEKLMDILAALSNPGASQ